MKWHATQTSEDGGYVIEDLVAGEYEVFARALRHGPISVNADTVLDLQLPNTHFSGLVTEERGEVPIAGAEIQVSERGADEFRNLAYLHTDHFGRFSIQGIEADQLVVTVYKPGYGLFREQVSFSTAERSMRIRLERNAGIKVEVQAQEASELPRILNVTEIRDRSAVATFRLSIDAGGATQIPSALVGATLFLWPEGYASMTVADWNGQPLRLQLTAAEWTASQ